MGNSIKSALHTNLRDIHIAHKQQFTCISYPHLQYIILKRFARFTLKEAAECSRIHGSQRGYFIQVDLSRIVFIQVSYDLSILDPSYIISFSKSEVDITDREVTFAISFKSCRKEVIWSTPVSNGMDSSSSTSLEEQPAGK